MIAGDGSISFDEFRELMLRYEHTSAAAAAAKQHTAGSGHHPHQSSDATSQSRGSTDSPLRSAANTTTTTTTTTSTTAAGRPDADDDLRDAFQVFDKDKDGFLSATDLRSVGLHRLADITPLWVRTPVSGKAGRNP